MKGKNLPLVIFSFLFILGTATVVGIRQDCPPEPPLDVVVRVMVFRWIRKNENSLEAMVVGKMLMAMTTALWLLLESLSVPFIDSSFPCLYHVLGNE
ncbi:hypothetical protein Lal_00012330 [Lupinus albus]|nr:hypothetical protein Lal_00012330 [Lupinus albus]